MRLHQSGSFRVRPVLNTMPTRGWSLLLQVGGVWGRETVWGQAKTSPEYSDIPISCPVSSGLKKPFWTVSWDRYMHQCTHTHTYIPTHRQTYNHSPHWINLFSFALCQQYSGLCCAKKRSLNQRSLYRLLGLYVTNPLLSFFLLLGYQVKQL